MIQVLATDNSDKHSPERWGRATAYSICPLDETLDGQRKRCAEEMREQFQTILTKWHATVQHIEQERLAADPTHLHAAFGATGMIEEIMEELTACTTDTPWFYLWGRADVSEIIGEIIDSHIRTNQQHERMAYARAHPDDVDAQTYLNFFEKGQT